MAALRMSWIHPDLAAQVRDALARGLSSWEDVFTDEDGAGPALLGAPPAGLDVPAEAWPRLASHVARVERVRAVIARAGLAAATQRFARSPHAVERATLVEGGEDADLETVAGVLACDLDELMAYGHFLSRLVELGAATDPAGTVARFERFVAAASRVVTEQPSWPERLRVARDGLAALYVRTGRVEDADALYRERFLEEPGDTTVPIGAARAFLEAGALERAVAWLEHAQRRAEALGRDALAARLRAKAENLRARLN